jgi:hypothetical protein
MARRKKVIDEDQAVPEVPGAPSKSKGNPDQITWTRPSGTTLTTNASEATIAYAESQGWKR